MDDIFTQNMSSLKSSFDNMFRDIGNMSRHIENEGKNLVAHVERINNDVNTHLKRTFIDPFLQ